MQVFFCTTIRNRWQSLARLLRNISEFEELTDFKLLVTDQGSTDADLTELLQSAPFPANHIRLATPHFNRSRGLNIAAAHTEARPDDILYFTDVDMVMSPDYLRRLRVIVQPGTCWFPICYSLHRDKPRSVYRDSRSGRNAAHGWWRTEGKGMCGFTAADFRALGGWDEEIGRSYGKEDGDLARRAQRHGLVIVRQNTEGLFHCWHPKQRNDYQQ